MATVLLRFRVKDYQQWKSVFTSKVDFRKSNGILSERYYQEMNDPNQVTLILEVTSVEASRKFMELPELKQAQQTGGVLGPPEMHVLVEG
jgi:hypothetical protein